MSSAAERDQASREGRPWCADCGGFDGPFHEVSDPWMVVCSACLSRLGLEAKVVREIPQPKEPR